MVDHEINETTLPHRWAWTILGEVVDTTHQRRHPQHNPDLPYIGLENVESETMHLLGTQSASNLKSMADYFESGDVLYSRLRPYLNKVLRPDFEGLCSSEFIIFRQLENLNNKYLQYLINSYHFVSFAMSRISGDRPRVDIGDLSTYPFPLAPLNEQHRIVEEIEAQFSRLDAWLETMQKLREQLRSLRTSILNAAIKGQLTQQNPNNESAEILLQRILDDRRRKWEENYLANLHIQGKPMPKDDMWKEKYAEPEAPDINALPQLPVGWVWATPDQLASSEDYSLAIGPFGSNLKVDDYQDNGIPLVFVRNIKSGNFRETNYISQEKANELTAHHVNSGDILITKMGDPPGDAIIYPDGLSTAIITSDCIKWKITELVPFTSLYVHFMHSPFMRSQILEITKGVAQKKVSLGRFKKIAIPLPPIAEQQRILALVDSKLSLIERLEETTQVNLKRARRMYQSILKKAFEGRLVKQDVNDESASKLLERIKQERKKRFEEQKLKPKQQREPMTAQVTKNRASLFEILVAAGQPLTPNELFKRADFQPEEVDKFYEELRVSLRHSRERIIFNREANTLEAASDENR